MPNIADLKYQNQMPDNRLADYVQWFWKLENGTPEKETFTILPDGYFDILFISIGGKPFRASLLGLAARPSTNTVAASCRVFAISFKLPAAEYILKTNISALLNTGKHLPANFWDAAFEEIEDLDSFSGVATAIMLNCLDKEMDSRKQQLFHHIYQSAGLATVEQLADVCGWSSRQINRYFQNNFGLSLKAYCNILRFRASFDELHKGQLFPGEGYFDQPHFIREVNKFAGTSPKHLANNKNDRFIQLSTLPGN